MKKLIFAVVAFVLASSAFADTPNITVVNSNNSKFSLTGITYFMSYMASPTEVKNFPGTDNQTIAPGENNVLPLPADVPQGYTYFYTNILNVTVLTPKGPQTYTFADGTGCKSTNGSNTFILTTYDLGNSVMVTCEQGVSKAAPASKK